MSKWYSLCDEHRLDNEHSEQWWIGHVRNPQLEADEARNQANETRTQPPRPSRPYTFNDAPPTDRKTPKQPDPELYDGNRDELRGFMFELKSKLRANADWFPTEDSRVAYAVGRLKGLAERRLLPLVESDNESTIRTIEGFYKALETAFGDPDKKATAQRYIQRLRQANRPFHQYLADFEAHICDTGWCNS